MAILDDISIAANGDIRRTGAAHGGISPGYYTVLELHRALQDLADNGSESGDDLISIVRTDPSSRSTDNIVELLAPYNIDDDLSEYIYDGSIVQAGGAVIYDGFVNFGNASSLIIHQNGAVLINDFWNSNGGLNPDANAGISHRFMLKVRTGGVDIDGRRVLGLTRTFGSTYGEFPVNGTARGNNVLALSEANDLNNQTASGTVATWIDIDNIEGYQTIDLNNGAGPQPYYSNWDFGARTVNQFYERMKYLTRLGTAETIYGLDGDVFRGITHEITIDTPTGTFDEPEAVSWSTGTGQLLAINSPTAGTKMWIQLLSGVAPVDNAVITGGTSGATAAVNVTVTSRTVVAPFVGQSTGTAIIGSYGLGIEAADLTVSDSLTDLNDTPQQPPNQQSFTVSGLIIGEDYVHVGPVNVGGDNVLLDQLTANGAQLTASTTFVVNEVIPSDTPASGSIRVFDGTSHQKVLYSSYSGSTFTLTTNLGHDINDDADAYISYIDKLATSTSESYTYIYSSSRALYVKVRDGGVSPIVSFETPATAGANGGSVTAIRTSDV
jgi:hypothetical protein